MPQPGGSSQHPRGDLELEAAARAGSRAAPGPSGRAFVWREKRQASGRSGDPCGPPHTQLVRLQVVLSFSEGEVRGGL